MTEQEAEALAARLTGVWKPKSHFIVDRNLTRTLISAPLEEGIRVEYAKYSHGDVSCGLTTWLRERKYHYQFVSLYVPSPLYYKFPRAAELRPVDIGDEEAIHPLQAEWLPLFRRNCWLSGCPIEASAHEKAEWMQGFSQEELQAWNLKM